MAIEVLRRGEVPIKKHHVVVCKKCNSMLRYLTSDAQRIEVRDENEGQRGVFYQLQIVCPVCGEIHRKLDR